MRPSGIRLGTPAATTRGMQKQEMKKIANWIISALKNHTDESNLSQIKSEVESMCLQFPVPGI
jgi:glycine hydroxymethyltransferase